MIGNISQYPTESQAQRALDALRLTINQSSMNPASGQISFDTLVNHYREHELPDVFFDRKPLASIEEQKTYATQYAYEVYIQRWILPRWNQYRVGEIKAVQVESWLRNLCSQDGAPLANGTRAKIRNIMSAIYSHAIRWDWTDKNPITSVRQSAKRRDSPDILSPEELMALLKELQEPLRTAVELDAFTGLRRGELFGLQWQDVDFESLVIHIRRSVVLMVAGPPKTEASRKDVPLDAALAESLLRLRVTSPYRAATDWVFASHRMKGRQPTLAGNAVAPIRQASYSQSGHNQERRMAHLSSHVYNTAKEQWGGRQSSPGTPSSRKCPRHDGYLRSGHDAREACRTKQTCSDGPQERTRAKRYGRHTVVEWTFLDVSQNAITRNYLKKMAGTTGLEPAASAVTVQHRRVTYWIITVLTARS